MEEFRCQELDVAQQIGIGIPPPSSLSLSKLYCLIISHVHYLGVTSIGQDILSLLVETYCTCDDTTILLHTVCSFYIYIYNHFQKFIKYFRNTLYTPNLYTLGSEYFSFSISWYAYLFYEPVFDHSWCGIEYDSKVWEIAIFSLCKYLLHGHKSKEKLFELMHRIVIVFFLSALRPWYVEARNLL